MRSVAGGLAGSRSATRRRVDQAVVDRFARFTVDRAVIGPRIDYANRVRLKLADPFDAERIKAPVTVLWGDRDRLCIPAGTPLTSRSCCLTPGSRCLGIGHTPQIECPDVVADTIEDLARQPQ